MATPAIEEIHHLGDISVVSLEITFHSRGALNIHECLMWSLFGDNSVFIFQMKWQKPQRAESAGNNIYICFKA